MLDYITEVYDDIFLAEIPLKGNPLKSINIYIIKTDNGNLIIDTGFNTDEIKNLTMGFIRDLDLDMSNTKLFLTHLHSDHTGLVNFYDSMNVPVIMGEVDSKLHIDFMNRYGEYWPKIEKYGHMQGLDTDNLKIEDHPGYKFRPHENYKYINVNPGDVINIGPFKFDVIDLSGHTPGMLGLYEKEKSILFCGDHILGKITPNIQFWGFEFGDSLGTYINNLNKVKNLNIKYLFSSHRFLISNVNERIEELKSHHGQRLNEILKILEKNNKCTVKKITENLHWDINCKNWEDFPKSQKWFAAGEAHAHLEHLRAKNMVDFIKDDNDILHYFLIK